MNSSYFFGISSLVYIFTLAFYLVYMILKNERIGKIAGLMATLGFVSQTCAFLLRWLELRVAFGTGFLVSVPLTDLYETLMFFSWCLMLINIYIEKRYKIRFFGVFLTSMAVIAIAFVDTVGAGKGLQPIVPMLKSGWLLAHVSLSMLAYAAFGASFVCALIHLISLRNGRSNWAYILWSFSLSAFFASTVLLVGDFFYAMTHAGASADYRPLLYVMKSFSVGGWTVSGLLYVILFFFIWYFGVSFPRILDRFSLRGDFVREIGYDMALTGLTLFIIGALICGSVWSDKVWCRFWAWEPKETWALATCAIYSVDLHLARTKRLAGAGSSALMVVGFICVMITYIGVNLFMTGLHSFGSL